MNVPRLDLPINIELPTDGIGNILDAAASSVGPMKDTVSSLTDTAGAVGEQVGSQVSAVVEDTWVTRLTLRHLLIGAAAVGTVALVVVLLRRRGEPDPQRRDAGAANPN